MIKTKEKICKGCKLPRFIFSKGYCRLCSGLNGEKSGKWNSPRKQIKVISSTEKARLEKYKILREERLSLHPVCEICNINPSVEIHHPFGRIGNNLYKKLTAICRECHLFTHLKSENNNI